MPKTVLTHGARWYNNDKDITCPECNSEEMTSSVVNGTHIIKEQEVSIEVEGPGVLCSCTACHCRFFIERDAD